MTRRRPAAAGVLALVCASLSPRPAQAWDPSRTHVGITERAVATSDVHRRWMEGSAGALGWFSPLRIDPATLDPHTRRALVVAMRRAHASVGAVAPGGPGACPPQPAPTETLQRCVDGDVWEASALGWLRVGIALEVADRTRLLHHFADRDDPASAQWHADGRHVSTWRRIERRAGGALAARVGRSGFSGQSSSALGWMATSDDAFAPAAMFAHRRAAALAPTAAERQRHFALALVACGALLHVVQDLSLPAHARGDLLGTMVPLSADLRDRGSPLAEYARLTFGRAMPQPLELLARTDETAAPASLRALLLGDAAHEGLIEFTARRFLSDGHLPVPRVLDEQADGAAAARAWLADNHAGLDAAELAGATLSPWPAEAGYLRSGTGRALAAFARDDDGTVRAYLDRRVLREHALVLLPRAVEATVATLELLWPRWPETTYHADANVLELDADPTLAQAELAVVVERADGTRTVVRRVALLPARSRVRNIRPASLPEGAHVVLVLQAAYADGQRIVIERRLDSPPAPRPDATPAPDATAPPATTPPATTPPATTPPATTPPATTPPATTPPATTPPATTPPATTPPAATPVPADGPPP